MKDLKYFKIIILGTFEKNILEHYFKVDIQIQAEKYQKLDYI